MLSGIFLAVFLVLGLTVIISASLVVYGWFNRPIRSGSPFRVMMMGVTIWGLAYLIELITPGLPMKIFWTKVGYIGVAVTPTAWLVFALSFSGRREWLHWGRLALLSLVPLLSLAGVFTNEMHGLVWRRAYLDTTEPLAMLGFEPGPLFWVYLLYSYLVVLAATVVFLRSVARSYASRKGQIFPILIAVAAPWLGNLAYVFWGDSIGKIDLTTVGFSVTGLALGWSIYRHRLLDVLPVAHRTVLNSLQDDIFVFDHLDRLVELNDAAAAFLGRSGADLLQGHYQELFARWPLLVEKMAATDLVGGEIQLHGNPEETWFDLQILPLQGEQGLKLGSMVILKDISSWKRMERELRDSEERFRRLSEATYEGVAILDNEVILDASLSLARMFGYLREEIIGRSVLSLAAPESRDLISEHIRSESEEPYEAYGLRKDGSTFPGELIGGVSRFQGRTVRVTVIRDLTSRKNAEAALHRHTRFLTLLNEITNTANAMNDLQTLLEMLSYRLGDLFHATGCLITLWDDDHQKTLPRAAFGPLKDIYMSYTPGPFETSLTASILNYGHPFAVNDIREIAFLNASLVEQMEIRALLGLPLIADGKKLGAIIISFRKPHNFSADEIDRGTQVAAQIALVIAKAQLFARVQKLAVTDELTGLNNRRQFFTLGNRAFERARDDGMQLSAIMIDIDQFKRVNDTFGHNVGDRVLRGTGRRLAGALRETDILARYGGEEFVILLPEAGLVEAEQVGERLRRALSEKPFPGPEPVLITISIGVAEYEEDIPDLDALLRRSDQSLYGAKELGGNRVVANLQQSP